MIGNVTLRRSKASLGHLGGCFEFRSVEVATSGRNRTLAGVWKITLKQAHLKVLREFQDRIEPRLVHLFGVGALPSKGGGGVVAVGFTR